MTDEEYIHIAKNIADIRKKIDAAAKKANRDPKEILLLGAAKGRSTSEIKAAAESGIDAFGENRVQELVGKYNEGAYGNIPLHFIGPLQTNKVKYLIGKVALIQSVDSEKLGSFISNLSLRKGVRTDILLEVNIGDESTKAGVEPEKAHALAEKLFSLPGIALCGLMAIPPLDKSEASFAGLREIFEDIRKNAPGCFATLSMGMTNDYENAIIYGSTIVRIGRGIFDRV